jgi:hypothetical protein
MSKCEDKRFKLITLRAVLFITSLIILLVSGILSLVSYLPFSLQSTGQHFCSNHFSYNYLGQHFVMPLLSDSVHNAPDVFPNVQRTTLQVIFGDIFSNSSLQFSERPPSHSFRDKISKKKFRFAFTFTASSRPRVASLVQGGSESMKRLYNVTTNRRITLANINCTSPIDQPTKRLQS